MFFPPPPPPRRDDAPPEPAPPASGGGPVSPEEADLRAFVGPNADFYLEAWAPVLAGHGGVRGFNRAALVLTPTWLLYRRMYRHAAAVYAVSPRYPATGEVVPLVGLLAGAGVALVGGLWGNSWYLAHARRTIARAAGPAATRGDRLAAVRRAGGADLIGAVAGALVIGFAVRVVASALLATRHY